MSQGVTENNKRFQRFPRSDGESVRHDCDTWRLKKLTPEEMGKNPGCSAYRDTNKPENEATPPKDVVPQLPPSSCLNKLLHRCFPLHE